MTGKFAEAIYDEILHQFFVKCHSCAACKTNPSHLIENDYIPGIPKKVSVFAQQLSKGLLFDV